MQEKAKELLQKVLDWWNKFTSKQKDIYSIVETAKANGLDVFLYLEQLLMHMTDWDHSPEYLDKLMPWSDSMQEACGK